MRPRKDPGIRQEAFILAATELFMEQGYESVSVRDVLDAVGDKTASPSVFYYYFPSKDALYRACVNAVAQNYMQAIREGFSMEGKTIDEWMLSLVTCMETYLLNERNLLLTGKSTPNRLFILDMRDQVTRQVSSLWAEYLPSMFGLSVADAQSLAQFLTGGISEMMFSYMLGGIIDHQSVRRLSASIVRFCTDAIGLPDIEKKKLLQVLSDLHEQANSL